MVIKSVCQGLRKGAGEQTDCVNIKIKANFTVIDEHAGLINIKKP